jgi:Ca2+-binding RTX toxin-like protein
MSLIERLEGRRLMSVSISTSPDGSVLTVSNAANVSVIEFDVGSARQVSVTDNSNPAGPGVTLCGNFQTLVIIGTNGDDQILLNTFDLNTVIDGGNGNDFITAFIGSTQTTAGTANVMVSGDNGSDFITVDGSTNSLFTVQEQGTFFVNGGNGDDTIQILEPINVVVIPSRGNDAVVA